MKNDLNSTIENSKAIEMKIENKITRLSISPVEVKMEKKTEDRERKVIISQY